jgi:hypothetical protein
MAQTGYTPILIYSSSTASAAPSASNLTNSTLGSELAINITDGKLFYKDNANAVQVVGWKTVPTTAGGTGLTSYTAGDLVYYASGTTFTKLAIGASGRWLGSSGTAPQWNAPAALTKTDDTNVTLTLGGSASTALLNAASLTLGWTGTLAVSRGGTGTGTAFTAGSVLFAGASGVYSQNNAQFFWDNTNNRLGLGLTNPSYPLEIGMTNSVSLVWQRTGVSAKKWGFQSDNDATYIANVSDNTLVTGFFNGGGVSIGNTTNPGATNLSVTGSTSSALFTTSTGQVVPASGVTTTIFTCPSLNNGCYIVTCNIPGQAPPTYSAVALVRVGGTTLNLTSLAAATTLTISVSGQNIRVVQNSGGTNAVDWTVTRLS